MRPHAIALSLFVGIGCAGGAAADAVSPAASIEYERFRSLPYSERREKINELPVDLRVRAYFDMIDEYLPPDILLAAVIAPSGDELVLATWRALEAERGDLEAGLLLLREIQVGEYAQVREKPELMDFLDRRLERMEPSHRGRCEDLLRRIRE